MVCFIYRPEYYGLTEDENGMPTDGIGEIIVAKHRNGSLDSIRLRFIKELTRFDNLNAFESVQTGMVPNGDFDDTAETITLGSKMNDEDDDVDFNKLSPDEVPF